MDELLDHIGETLIRGEAQVPEPWEGRPGAGVDRSAAQPESLAAPVDEFDIA